MAKAEIKTYNEVGPGGIRFQLTPRGKNNIFNLRFTNPRTGRRQPWLTTKTSLIGEARAFASQYLQEFVVDGNDPKKVTVGTIMQAYIAKQKKRNKKEVQRMWDNRMSEIFDKIPANDVRTTDIRAYKRHCGGEEIGTGLFQGVKPYKRALSTGTINRDLANLRAAFKYAYKGEVISRMPAFEIDNNDDARRTGFLQQTEFDQIMASPMGLWLRALLHILYETGVRVSEACSIKVEQCDFVNKIIRLEKTKNGEPRQPPMTSAMYQLLLACAEGKNPSEPIIDAPTIWSIEDRWNELVEFAGFAGEDRNVLMHDMRRSAVRNMMNRGVCEKDAMLISGHKTRWVFDHYNIRDERNMRKAAELIEAGAELERQEAAALEQAAEQVIARAKRAVTNHQEQKEAVQ